MSGSGGNCCVQQYQADRTTSVEKKCFDGEITHYKSQACLRPLVDGRGAARRRGDVDLVARIHKHAVRGRRFLEPKACNGEKTSVAF